MQIAIQLTREITSNHMRVGAESVPETPKRILHFSHKKRVFYHARVKQIQLQKRSIKTHI
jgi:hypothetical protein